jgi:hypothetical protein
MSPQLVNIKTMTADVKQQIMNDPASQDAQAKAMAVVAITVGEFVLERLDTIATALETLANKTS